jgi:hypothetical protein
MTKNSRFIFFECKKVREKSRNNYPRNILAYGLLSYLSLKIKIINQLKNRKREIIS